MSLIPDASPIWWVAPVEPSAFMTMVSGPVVVCQCAMALNGTCDAVAARAFVLEVRFCGWPTMAVFPPVSLNG